MSLESPLNQHNGDYQGLQKASSSPEPHDDSRAAGRHRRNYQACDRCRGRKVKCDLGPVDAPHDPPCKRCQRERAECIFADQRKKTGDLKGTQSEERDEEPANSKRRRIDSGASDLASRYSSIGDVIYNAPHDRLTNVDPLLQAMQAPTSVPIHRSPPMNDPRMALPGVQTGHNVRFQGTSRQDVKQEELRSSGAEATFTRNQSRTTQDNLSTLWQAAQKIGGIEEDQKKMRDYERYAAGGPAPYEEALTKEQTEEREKGLKAWRLARFVRAGWFTAEEALRYVEYFYTNLQPMTPVDVTEFRSPRRHLALLTEEPVLAVAILTIASRYMRLSGRSAETRSHKIHERLWASLMEQIQRLMWGQEQFGGGFTGAGVSRVRESASGQITWPGSLRTLGTIEALLLLSDWQPRSLHFPPDDDDNHLLNINYDQLHNLPMSNGASAHNPSLDALPFASWLEPAWRSDKMCWMLMGLSQALSMELGVFDPKDAEGPGPVSIKEQQRKIRIRRMVLVYVAQISGRNGIPNPLRFSEWAPEVDEYLQGPIDHMQGLWVHIARIMNTANRDIFKSRQFTRELTQSHQYRASIAAFAPQLEAWVEHFEQVKGVLQEPMLSILLIEYEYARLYINSLGLQNVVETWMRTDPKNHDSMSSVSRVVAENKRYIHEVTDACVHILEIVQNVLGSNSLRDAPIRVYLRCLSAMMFTLKRLSLGSHEKLVQRCLNLLDRVCMLLTREVVDDVHLCSQTSVLIQSIVKHIKKTFIRVAKPNTSSVPSREGSRAQTPHRSMVENGQMQSMSSTLPTASQAYPIDHLAHIPARPMAEFKDQTFIAPPNYNFQTQDFDFIDDSSLDHSMLSENPNDWVTMPIDTLMNSTDTNVEQGFHSIGPMIGSRDMLEVLTNQDYNTGLQDYPNSFNWTPNTPYQGYSPHLGNLNL